MRIIGIDCGRKTGYAVIRAQGERIELESAGTFPIAGEGRLGLVKGAYSLLRTIDTGEIVLSEIVQMPRIPTDHGALEVQGVCRLFATIGYNPSTIHSQLGTRNKAETRTLVQRILGYELKIEQHCIDAAAAAICHAVKLGVVTLRIDLRGETQRQPRKRANARESQVRGIGGHSDRGLPGPGEPITAERAVELLQSGKARVVR